MFLKGKHISKKPKSYDSLWRIMETISLDEEKKEQATPFKKNEDENSAGSDEVTVSFQGGGQSLEIEMEHEQRFTILSWFCCCRSRRDSGTTFEERVRLGNKEHRLHSREKIRKKEEGVDGESILKVSKGLKSGFS